MQLHFSLYLNALPAVASNGHLQTDFSHSYEHGNIILSPEMKNSAFKLSFYSNFFGSYDAGTRRTKCLKFVYVFFVDFPLVFHVFRALLAVPIIFCSENR